MRVCLDVVSFEPNGFVLRWTCPTFNTAIAITFQYRSSQRGGNCTIARSFNFLLPIQLSFWNGAILKGDDSLGQSANAAEVFAVGLRAEWMIMTLEKLF